ncbi:hypothetical protein T11_3101 [Trichinella zimbabwensis]|uniref:Uncharacterized protein n=1 Tax=Trichinella zimbabwensis TaxID=268475 RepID=A0A0V1GMQ7_9BILA|nr:hypothetical protein T11_3101 [Trichinella zimbabwensis]
MGHVNNIQHEGFSEILLEQHTRAATDVSQMNKSLFDPGSEPCNIAVIPANKKRSVADNSSVLRKADLKN